MTHDGANARGASRADPGGPGAIPLQWCGQSKRFVRKAWALPTPFVSGREEQRMSTVVEYVTELVAPILTDLGVELYDLEHTGPVLKVVVDRAGGIDLEALAEVTRNIS